MNIIGILCYWKNVCLITLRKPCQNVLRTFPVSCSFLQFIYKYVINLNDFLIEEIIQWLNLFKYCMNQRFCTESFEWIIQWKKKLTVTCCHLLAKLCNYTIIIFLNIIYFILIAIIDVSVYIQTIYPQTPPPPNPPPHPPLVFLW